MNDTLHHPSLFHKLCLAAALSLLFGGLSLGCDPAESGEWAPSSDTSKEGETSNPDEKPASRENGSFDDSEETDPPAEESDGTDDPIDRADTESDESPAPPDATDTDAPVAEDTDSEEGDITIDIDEIAETEPPSDTDRDGETPGWEVTNGYAVIADFTGNIGMELNQGAVVSTPFSTPVRCVSQEALIAFVKDNAALFTGKELETILEHRSFRERGYGAQLLAGLLGLKLAGDFNHFAGKIDTQLSVGDTAVGALIEALAALEEASYTLSGTIAAKGLSPIPASPRFMVGVTRLNLSGGRAIRAIDTRVRATDAAGSQALIREAPGHPPLELEPAALPENAIALSHGHALVASADVGIETGEETTIDVEKSVNIVPHQELVSFVESNTDLFSDNALEIIRSDVSYTDDSRASALLLGLLGLGLGGSFDYFSEGREVIISPFREADGRFITALSALSEKTRTRTLSGEHTAVGRFGIATIPHVYVDVVRVDLPDGTPIRTIDTNARVGDEKGDTGAVCSKAGQPPLYQR